MGLAAAYIEDAADTAATTSILAAHTSEEDEPEEENHNERGEDVEQYIPSAARLLVANVGFELAVFGLAPPFDVFGKLVSRGYVGLDGELAVFGLGLIISLPPLARGGWGPGFSLFGAGFLFMSFSYATVSKLQLTIKN